MKSGAGGEWCVRGRAAPRRFRSDYPEQAGNEEPMEGVLPAQFTKQAGCRRGVRSQRKGYSPPSSRSKLCCGRGVMYPRKGYSPPGSWSKLYCRRGVRCPRKGYSPPGGGIKEIVKSCGDEIQPGFSFCPYHTDHQIWRGLFKKIIRR